LLRAGVDNCKRTEQAGAHGPAVEAVIDVAAICGAPPLTNQARVSEYAKVIRNQVLRFASDRCQLANLEVRPTEVARQLPSQLVAQQTEYQGSCQATIISNCLDVLYRRIVIPKRQSSAGFLAVLVE
jgi:hypothetical protein